MSKKIVQLSESEVIQAIVDNRKVIRVNLNKMTCCDLASKSVNSIRNDFDKDDYIYFVVEDNDD